MKLKTMMMAGIAVLMLASCSKEYTCKCTSTSSGSSSNSSGETTYKSEKKKKDAEDWCKSYESSATVSSGGMSITSTTTCKLQ